MRASFTAETMALQRAFETRRGPGHRLFADPYAEAFLRPSLRVVAAASGRPGLRRLALAGYDLPGGPGPRPSAIIRTKVIDDAVVGAAAICSQCVLLGAGYDTRAYRLPTLAGHWIIEVDHPATQAAKLAVLERLGLTGTGDVAHLGVDFEHDDLAAGLLAAGFTRDRPSMFLWEGVTNYLTPAAVDTTLGLITALAAPGSVLIVTYVDRRALDHPSPFPEAQRWVRAVARSGEPWLFGLHPDQAAAYFAQRGFAVRSDVSALEASRAARAGGAGCELGSGLYRIAVAAVAAST